MHSEMTTRENIQSWTMSCKEKRSYRYMRENIGFRVSLGQHIVQPSSASVPVQVDRIVAHSCGTSRRWFFLRRNDSEGDVMYCERRTRRYLDLDTHTEGYHKNKYLLCNGIGLASVVVLRRNEALSRHYRTVASIT